MSFEIVFAIQWSGRTARRCLILRSSREVVVRSCITELMMSPSWNQKPVTTFHSFGQCMYDTVGKEWGWVDAAERCFQGFTLACFVGTRPWRFGGGRRRPPQTQLNSVAQTYCTNSSSEGGESGCLSACVRAPHQRYRSDQRSSL